ncbi:MAG: lipid II flippase MurJ [Bryobacterales bacterium]
MSSAVLLGVVYQHGRFTAFDTEQTSLALSAYCLGLMGYAGVKVLTPSFYALDEVRLPAAVAVLSIFVNYGLNWAAVRGLGWGHAGLALATASVATINFIVLFLAMRRRADGLHGRRIFEGLLKIGTATATMAGVVWFVSGLFASWLGDGFAGRSLGPGRLDAAGRGGALRRLPPAARGRARAGARRRSGTVQEEANVIPDGRYVLNRAVPTPPHGFSPSAT